MGRKHKFNAPAHRNQGARISAPGNADTGSTQGQTPVFGLEYLRGQYCLSECSDEHKAAFASRLHLLSGKTWGEINIAPRKGIGFEKIKRDQLNATVPAHVSSETAIIAFRYHGNHPMVGYRDGRVFHVLFIDRDFTLYDHE
jgi:hypothetical protein